MTACLYDDLLLIIKLCYAPQFGATQGIGIVSVLHKICQAKDPCTA